MRVRPDGQDPAPRRTPGPLAGMVLGATLGAAVFLLAALLHDGLSRRRAPAPPPPGFARGSEARAPVRVLATLGAEGVRAVLLPLREDGGPTEAEEALLDAALFPSGPSHRWARILVANPPGGAPYTLSLRPGAVVLDAAAGPAGNEDLASAVAARAGSLSPHRLMDLRVAHAADEAVVVPPGGFVRVLAAFPAGADPRAAAGATLAGGVRLLPREVAVERIRATLLDGRVDSLHDADRAEAKSRGAGGGAR